MLGIIIIYLLVLNIKHTKKKNRKQHYTFIKLNTLFYVIRKLPKMVKIF